MDKNPYWIIFLSVTLGLPKLGFTEKSYQGAQVWTSTVRDLGDLVVFKSLVASNDISLWNLSPTRADYLVHENKRTKVNRALMGQNMNHTVMIMSVQQRIDQLKTKESDWDDSSLRIGHRLDFKSYPTPRILDEYLDYLAENYKSICQVKSIGTTVENRSIRMIKISNGDPTNEVAILQGGIHAREWASITTSLYIANNIITKYDAQPKYMRNKDWYIIPVINPDGYAYSHEHDRLWRKNRAKNKNSHCIGVDINRNFAKFWDKSGISGDANPCGDDYSGPAAFSERESKALRDLLASIKKTPKIYVDFHSFGQIILYPWGIKSKSKPNVTAYQYLETTAKLVKKTILKATRYIYTYGTPPEVLYEGHGSAMDWFYSQGIPLSYTIETRDNGKHGFLLPPEEIEGTGKELLGGIRAIAKVSDPEITMRGTEQHSWF